MNTLTFHNKKLNIINRDNQIWLTSAELAKALQYANSRAVTMIFNKYKDEFSIGMTEVLDLSTSLNLQARTRIFSLRGAHLIAMFARTPIAKDFRKWVLDILDKEVANNTVISKVDHPMMVTIGVNKTSLDCLIYHAKVALDILESTDTHKILERLGNQTVIQVYYNLQHALIGANNLHVGVKEIGY